MSLPPFAKSLKISDYDRYLCALLAPEPARHDLFVLLAFNQEIAKTSEITREEMTALIRLQWWREAIEGVYTYSSRKHEILEALAPVIHTYELPKSLLLELVDAREHDAKDGMIIPSLTAMENYTRNTSVNLLLLAVGILGNEDRSLTSILNHIGTAWGMIGLLRSTVYHLAKGKCYLPHDMMVERSISLDNVGSEKFFEECKTIVETICSHINDHLTQVHSYNLDRQTRNAAIPLLMLGTLAQDYVKRIKKNNYDILTQSAELSPLRKQLGIFFSLISGKY